MKRILFLSLWAVLGLVACSDDDTTQEIGWDNLIYQSVLDMADGTLMSALDTYGEYNMRGSLWYGPDEDRKFITGNAVMRKKETENGYKIIFRNQYNEEICSTEISGFSHLLVRKESDSSSFKNLYLTPHEPSMSLHLEELSWQQLILNRMYVKDNNETIWLWIENAKRQENLDIIQKLYDNYQGSKSPLK